MDSKLKLVGMVHLAALPGAPGFGGSFDTVIERALADARALEKAGFDAILIENYGDTPFHRDHVPPHTISALTVAAHETRKAVSLPIGIQVLRNDAFASIAIASTIGAEFIRVNVLAGVMLTDQGMIEGKAAELLRYRKSVAPTVEIWADLHVKHAYPLPGADLTLAARELVERSLADTLILSGEGTGMPASLEELARVRSVVSAPIAVGSGASIDNILDYVPVADAVIVGTSIKKGKKTENPVDFERAEELIRKARTS